MLSIFISHFSVLTSVLAEGQLLESGSIYFAMQLDFFRILLILLSAFSLAIIPISRKGRMSLTFKKFPAASQHPRRRLRDTLI